MYVKICIKIIINPKVQNKGKRQKVKLSLVKVMGWAIVTNAAIYLLQEVSYSLTVTVFCSFGNEINLYFLQNMHNYLQNPVLNRQKTLFAHCPPYLN